jgi:hypothetical protein
VWTLDTVVVGGVFALPGMLRVVVDAYSTSTSMVYVWRQGAKCAFVPGVDDGVEETKGADGTVGGDGPARPPSSPHPTPSAVVDGAWLAGVRGRVRVRAGAVGGPTPDPTLAQAFGWL